MQPTNPINPTFIEWDYELMKATRYRRVGECNRCGECCQGRIAFRAIFLDEEKKPEKEDIRNGGDTTTEEGIWNEVEDEDNRIFFQIVARETSNKNCGRLTGRDETMQELESEDLEDAGCSIYKERPKICSDFPFSPADVAIFPSCSYSFEEIDHWKIEVTED